jgi:seryl-tRNA synthetase
MLPALHMTKQHARHPAAPQRHRRRGPAPRHARFSTRCGPFQALEAERKQLQTQTEDLQARRNSLSKQIGMLKGKGEDASGPMAEVAGIGDTLKASAQRLAEIQDQISDAMLSIPNLPHESVPVGKDETENVEVRRVGTPRTFDFESRITSTSARSASISRPPRRSLARASPSCVAAWRACIARWSS